ncbi:unnamed protein product [Closterium sp. Naga37s-1]|nr:unnamed protein product [Closterium sp. Naga37s-1]
MANPHSCPSSPSLNPPLPPPPSYSLSLPLTSPLQDCFHSFHPQAFLFLRFDDYIANPRPHIAQTLDFLGFPAADVAEEQWAGIIDLEPVEQRPEGVARAELDGFTREYLKAFFAPFNADLVMQMADKNHPNIVRLLGFAVGGDVRSKIEQVLIYEFVSNGNIASLKHPTMDAPPGDAVQRLAELAMSCTVERTASHPNKALISNELQTVREEVAGKEESGAAIKVDAQVQEMKDAVAGEDSLEIQLQIIEDSGSFITEDPV